MSLAVAGALLAAQPAFAADTLELTPDLLVTGALIVVFVVIIFPINSLIFQPLFKVIDEREEKISGARSRADQVQTQAQEALDRYEESIAVAYDDVTSDRRQHLDVARSELQGVIEQAKAEADGELGRARTELEGSATAARESLRGSAQELANLVAERILGRSLS